MTSATDSGRDHRSAKHFDNVLGVHRGNGGVLDLEVFTTVLNEEGLADALRILDRERAHTPPKLLKSLVAKILDHVWARERPQMQAWLRSLGLRPHWALNFVGGNGDGLVHFLPDGHLHSEIDEDFDVVVACGRHLDDTSRLKMENGAWISTLISPRLNTVFGFCRDCETIAGNHPQAQPRDEHDPLPADALDPALEHWRKISAPKTQTALLRGDDAATLMTMLVSGLDEIALAWATYVLSRYPRPNCLRALRFNGFLLSPSEVPLDTRIEQIAKRALDEGEWTQLLQQHLQTYFRDSPDPSLLPRNYWASMLLSLASEDGHIGKIDFAEVIDRELVTRQLPEVELAIAPSVS